MWSTRSIARARKDIVNRRIIAKICVLFVASLIAAMAVAGVDVQITIDRSLNSPTLTIKYSGARATLIEFRLNGISIGTRALSGDKASGETNFTLDMKTLQPGDNEFEVRLFDKSGRPLGSEKTYVTAETEDSALVKITNPKLGATVQGIVDVKLGFARNMGNVYVSFFIDNQFQAMTNASPYSFVWDTLRETNGWHEVEAWVVDENSATFKTRKVKVFINNPQGRTERRDPETGTGALVLPPPTQAVVASSKVPVASTVSAGTIASTMSTLSTPPLSPLIAMNAIIALVGAKVDVKSPALASPMTSNGRVVVPQSTEVKTAPATQAQGTPPATSAGSVSVSASAGAVVPATSVAATSPTTLRISKGEKMPNIGSFNIALNGKFVEFDVSPRVQEGVPLTPIRHLLEAAGGEVDWEHQSKAVSAQAEGRSIYLKVGDRYAKVDSSLIELEMLPFIERGRVIVPLSFIEESLKYHIEYDSKTGHVLITNVKN